MANPSLSIACIGGGISGLTLGRCLLRRGIPVVLYDRASSLRFHDYSISLHASTYRPLLRDLGVEERHFKQKVAVDLTEATVGSKDESGNASSSEFLQVHRGKLESWLREGLDIRFGHELRETKQQSNDGTYTTTLQFTNRPEIQSALVIGADGPHSTVRKALLPQHELVALPYVAFNGKRAISRGKFEDIYAAAMKGRGAISHTSDGSRLYVTISGISPDEVCLSWTYSRPARGSSDPLYKPNRPLAGATDIPDEFYKEVSSIKSSAFPKPFADILDATQLRQDRILHWVMRTTLVPDGDLRELVKKGVILMGDAAHAEPIIGGHGANVAIEDAVSLAERVASGKGLEDWYKNRYPKWQESHQKAESQISNWHKS